MRADKLSLAPKAEIGGAINLLFWLTIRRQYA